jgi:KAP family P-loop domain
MTSGEDDELHEDFARALQSYLVDRRDLRPVDLRDLAAAILRSARDDPSGLLPGRLERLGFDLGTAIASMDDLLRPDSESYDVLPESYDVDEPPDALENEEPSVPPQRATFDRTEWAPDAPAEKDLLGRERLAEVLAERLKRLAEPGSLSKRSFLIHVDGPWGAGKSTLFDFLQRQLEPAFLVVSVNAWREQRGGVQWWTLLTAVRRAVAAATPWYRRPLARLAGFMDQIRAGWVPFVAAIFVLVALLGGLVQVTNFDVAASGEVADSILKVIALASAAFAGLVTAARYLLPGSRRSAQGFVETTDNPMQEVSRLFARTLRRAKRPVVFLIDDLDRCDEGYVVEFLEVVQTLVRDAPRQLAPPRDHSSTSHARRKRAELAGPYAFIAADGRWIRLSYEKYYDNFKLTASPGRPLGYLFLEKVFQLHVRLPSITPTAREAFLSSLLVPAQRNKASADAQEHEIQSARDAIKDAGTETEVIDAARKAAHSIADPVARMEVLGDAAVRFSERGIEEVAQHALARYSIFLEPNPRSMKLFVNTYGVLRSLRTLEEVFVPTGPLALWTVLEIRWPFLADYLRAHPEAIDASTGDGVPEDIKVLLLEPTVGLVLKDAEAGPLTVDLIRECSGVA